MNRAFTGTFYGWLGWCILGGTVGVSLPEGDAWKALGITVGILAWIVAVGDIFMSCIPHRDSQRLIDGRGSSEVPRVDGTGSASSNAANFKKPAQAESLAPATGAKHDVEM